MAGDLEIDSSHCLGKAVSVMNLTFRCCCQDRPTPGACVSIGVTFAMILGRYDSLYIDMPPVLRDVTLQLEVNERLARGSTMLPWSL